MKKKTPLQQFVHNHYGEMDLKPIEIRLQKNDSSAQIEPAAVKVTVFSSPEEFMKALDKKASQ